MNLYHDLTVHATLARLERQNEAQAQIIAAQQRQIDLLEALIEVKYAPREELPVIGDYGRDTSPSSWNSEDSR